MLATDSVPSDHVAHSTEDTSLDSLIERTRRTSLLEKPDDLELFASIDTLSELDLRVKFKELLLQLKEKERDLEAAAEIGAKLVDSNTSLQTEQEELKKQLHAAKSKPSAPEDPTEYEYDPDAVPPETLEEKLAKAKTLSRKKSFSMYELVANLERSNADLRSQLEVALANVRDADTAHLRPIQMLRRSNTELQEQLRHALQDLRDTEQSHARTIKGLERNLDTLRAELNKTAAAAMELEEERRRLLKEKVETLKEKSDLEISDSEVIRSLQLRIREFEIENGRLAASKKDVERKLKSVLAERDQLIAANEELQDKCALNDDLKRDCERQAKLIEELKDRLESERFSHHAGDGSATASLAAIAASSSGGSRNDMIRSLAGEITGEPLTKEQEFQWNLWMDRSWQKLWEADVQGLRYEIDNLRNNRNQAYDRVRDQIGEMVTGVGEWVPYPFKSLTMSITSAVIGTSTTTAAAAVAGAGGVQAITDGKEEEGQEGEKKEGEGEAKAEGESGGNEEGSEKEQGEQKEA
ncbi:hypothetical protein HK102_002450 [Quaeritorhiza haematococci]|nr:hypothetical protein HK102_002450 [Quaeritorhiza haematococci]